MKNTLFFIVFLITVFACKTDVSKNTDQVEDIAIKNINIEIEKSPRSATLYMQRAHLHSDREAFDHAINDAKQALKLDSLNADYYHQLADFQIDYYRSRDAIKTMKTVVDLYPDNNASILKLSKLYFWLKQYDESISAVNHILYNDSQDAEAYFMLGMNFRDLNKDEKAMNSFQRAVELDADLTDGWIILGDFYDKKGDPLAYRYYDNATKIAPDNVQALHAKAYYLQNHKSVPEALEIYETINRINPKYIDAYLNAGVIFISLDSLEKAYEHFEQVIMTDSTNAIAYYYEGLIEIRKGNKKTAKDKLQTSIKLDPKNEKARELLTSLAE